MKISNITNVLISLLSYTVPQFVLQQVSFPIIYSVYPDPPYRNIGKLGYY